MLALYAPPRLPGSGGASIQDLVKNLYTEIFRSVFYVPGSIAKQTPTMVKDQKEHRPGPEPVDVILPVLFVIHITFQFSNKATIV